MMISTMKILHTVTLIMFSVSFYKICVESDSVPSSNNEGALSVVPDQEGDDADDGVTVVEEVSEIEYDKEAIFYPTKDWQKVEKGQAVPAGLHVRLNLETGEKEAKLMEGDDGMKYWNDGNRQGMINPKNKFFSRDELKKALKDFKAEAVDEETTRRREESVKKKFKKYEDLKKDLASMNMDIKTDGEIITTLVGRLKLRDAGMKEQLDTLTNLEFYVHQVDNAVMFCDMGGMTPLVQLLNNTHRELRAEAAFVLGSATQSNPKVQVQALETGSLPQLIRLLPTEEDTTVRSRVLFAISALLRHFPFAQQKFLKLGGLSALSQVFTDSGSEKLRIKAVTLLNDLLLEQEHIKEMDPEDSNVKLRMQQYKEVPLLEMMLEQGWCELVPTLLQATEHDVREKVLLAMTNLKGHCHNSFSKSYHRLTELQQEYQELAKTEEHESVDDQYFTKLLDSVNSILVTFARKEEL